mgnify:CR=1 FL=1
MALPEVVSVDKSVVLHFFSEKYWLMTSKLAKMIMKRPAMVRVILRNKSASTKENQSCKIKSNTQLTNNPRQA